MNREIRDAVSEAISREILTPSEVADLLGKSKASVSNLVQRGTLLPIKSSGKGSNLFLRSEIEQYRAYSRHPEKYHENMSLHISAPVLAALDIEILRNLDSVDFLIGYAQLNDKNREVASAAIHAVIWSLLTQQTNNGNMLSGNEK